MSIGGGVIGGSPSSAAVDFSTIVILSPTSSTRNVITPTGDYTNLVLKASSGQTAKLQQWQSSTGSVGASMEPNGSLSVYTLSVSEYVNIFNGCLNIGYGAAGLCPTGRVNGRYTEIYGGTASQVVETIKGAASQSANLTEWRDSSNNILSFVNKVGTIVTKVNSAPADGDLSANECSFWFDSTNGAAKMMFKGKSANGTVVSGSVTLS